MAVDNAEFEVIIKKIEQLIVEIQEEKEDGSILRRLTKNL
jgi:hypothetical protein